MQRVIVVGTSCAGKTTLAGRIAGRLQCPHVELDALHWGPNWQGAPRDVVRERVAKAIAAPAWVVDGNYRSMVQDLVWPRATDLVWLDYPFLVVLGRALWRTVRRAATKEELFGGNRESWRTSFLERDSILLWMVKTHHENARRYRAILRSGEVDHLRVHRLAHPADASRLLDGLGRS
jgi:adenylate kinase family enzyme